MSPYGPREVAFISAIKSGDLESIHRAARRLPEVTLKQALHICAAYRDEGDLYQRAAVRWLGRFCLEVKGATLEDACQVVEALERLPDHHEHYATDLVRLLNRRRSTG